LRVLFCALLSCYGLIIVKKVALKVDKYLFLYYNITGGETMEKVFKSIYFKDPEAIRKLEEIAEEEDRSLSWLVNEAVKEYVRNRE